ncbi:MAG: hypothetical protein K0U98_28165 [Deltaproteobacteria bacterium]|nr:hypothetical protein [Deltaproteobacteria bacterium]
MKFILCVLSILILSLASTGFAVADSAPATELPLPLENGQTADHGEPFVLEGLNFFNLAPEARSFCGDMDCQSDSECQDACPSAGIAYCDGCVCIFDGHRPGGGHGGTGIPGD